MHVIATAGHVDHGKSTLVRALTGMEPDRWAEERRRGMTIDLGFAWTTLDSGEQVAFVDVPGHHRFLTNMLAGIGPVPAVLFVVAADEGWSRQSEEHLAAIDALGVRHGLLAITRSDLAAPDDAVEQATARLADSSLGAVEAVAVSGTTGAGVRELRAALDRLVAGLPSPDTDARVRLWVDRAFTVRGSGTVVTGTLAAGTVDVGDVLDLHGTPVTVRGLQTTGLTHHSVAAVARIAVNLRGIARTDVARGDVLLTPDAWHLTAALDVRLSVEAGDVPAELVLHLGSAAVPARVRPLGGRLARLTVSAALPVQPGDRGVLRDPSRHCVAAGVVVLDADPPALTRRGAAAARADDLRTATGSPDLGREVARRGAVPRDHLRRLGIGVDESAAHSVGAWLVDASTWQHWVGAAPVAVGRWAAQHPLDPAMPTAALRRELRLPDDAQVLNAVAAEAGLHALDGRVSRPGIQADLDRGAAGLRTLVHRLQAAPFAAPERGELDGLRLGTRELSAAERAGVIVRVAPDIVLLPAALDEAVRLLQRVPQPFTTSAARQALGTTRRVVIPLLEHLDAQGITRRVDTNRRTVRMP